jgi:hypothetical protein
MDASELTRDLAAGARDLLQVLGRQAAGSA